MSIEKRDYELLYGMLKHVRKHGPYVRTLGICNVIEHYGGIRYKEVLSLFRSMCKEWPKFSGEIYYPVPEEYEPLDKVKMCRNAIKAFYNNDDIWTPINSYAKNRLELLDFCIEECKKILKQ